jgi:MFS family permease
MVSFDPQVMHEFAERMYARAGVVVVVSSLIGALLGSAMGIALAEFVEKNYHAPRAYIAIFCVVGLLGLAFGVITGQRRAFTLRLEAQKALCQLQIEANTRTAAVVQCETDEDLPAV